LNAGEQVVTDGQSRLSQGSRVAIIAPNGKAGASDRTIAGSVGDSGTMGGEVVTGTGVAPTAGVPASGAAQSAPPRATQAPIGTAVPQPSGGTTPGGVRP
jgi:hypothetical protein